MHAQSQPRPHPANPERACGVRKTGARARAFALLAPVFALMALTLPVSEAQAQGLTGTVAVTNSANNMVAQNAEWAVGNTYSFTWTFSGAVTGFSSVDFAVVEPTSGDVATGLTVGSTGFRGANGNTVFRANLRLTGEVGANTDLLIRISRLGITDSGGNNPGAGAIQDFRFTPTGPGIASIARQTPGDETTRATSLVWRVTFSTAVSGVNVADFALTLMPSATTTAPTISGAAVATGGNNAIWDVTATGGDLANNSYNGVIGLALATSPTITAMGNNDAVSDASPIGANETYTVDNTGPTVTVTSPGGTTKTSPIPIRIEFNEAVTGLDLNKRALDSDSANDPNPHIVLMSSDVVDENGDNAGLGGLTAGEETVNTEMTVWERAYSFQDNRRGMLTVTIPAGVAMDGAGNMNTASTPLVVMFDSTASLTLTLDDASISENGGTATLTATLDPAAVAPVTVTLTPPAGSGTAFTLGSTSLTIATGGTSATTTVTTRNNPSSDGNLEFVIAGAATSDGRNLTGEVTLTIEDDDVFSLPAVQDYTFDAGATVSVTLPEARNKSTAGTVTYVLEGTLPAGLDWDAANRTITGMPTTAAAAVTYTYKATDDRGAATDMPAEDVTFTIAIDLALMEGTGELADGDRLRFDELPVTFPEAVGATGNVTYELTRDPSGDLPEWLVFTNRMLTVDMAQARGRVPVLYTATDSATPTPNTATLQVTIGDDPERREARLGEMVGAVGRTLGWDMAGVIRNRARASRSGADAPVSVSGVSNVTSLDDLVSRGASVDIALNANAANGGGGGQTAYLWARAGRSEFDNEPLNDYDQDGSLTSLHAGVDFRAGPDRLFGAAFGWHDAEVDYDDREAGVAGDLELELLTINPYASQTRDRWHAWGTVGFGTGTMTYAEASQGAAELTSESDVTLWNAAGGLEYSVDTIGKADLTARGEGMFLGMDADQSDNENLEFGDLSTEVYGVRGEVEIGLPLARPGGGTMRPFVMLGARWDGGNDAADGATGEYGGGITARNEDFFADVSVRSRFGADDEVLDVTAWNVALGFDRANDHRGLAVELSHEAGPQPWDPFANDELAAASDTSADTADTPATLGATTRYGLDYRNGRMTPYNTLRFDGDLLTEVETGIQYRLSDISLGLKHVYEPDADADEHTLKLIGRITF